MPAGQPISGAVREEIIARTARGERPTDICREPGMPRFDSLGALARRDAWFGQRFREAQVRGRDLRRYRFDPAKAAEMLRRLAEGEQVHAILGRGGMPGRKTWRIWRANEPELAEALFVTQRERRIAQGEKRRRACHRPFDPALADRIVARVGEGIDLRSLWRVIPDLPSAPVLARWRREQPQFNRALRNVIKVANQRRQRRRLCNDEVIEAVADRVVEGETLNDVARDRGMPCATTLYAWARKRPDFYVALEAALEARSNMLADRALDLAEGRRPGAAAAFRRLKDKVERLDAKAGRLGPRERG